MSVDSTTDEDEELRKFHPTTVICERFHKDLEDKENIDIYQLCSILWRGRKYGSADGETYKNHCCADRARVKQGSWYIFEAFVCFIFQTVVLVLWIKQYSQYNYKHQNNYTNDITRIVGCVASVYISISVWTWTVSIEKQSLYQVFPSKFKNCPKYASKAWIIIGLFTNLTTLFMAIVGSNILIFWAENSLDVILNCVAMFFMVNIDNEIVASSDYENIKEWIREFEASNIENVSDDVEMGVGVDQQRGNAAHTLSGAADENKSNDEKETTPFVAGNGTTANDEDNICHHKSCQQDSNVENCCYKLLIGIYRVLYVGILLCAFGAPFAITIVPYFINDD